MSTEFNSCKDLEVTYQESGVSNPIDEMLSIQRKAQVHLHTRLPDQNPHPDNLVTVGQIFDWLRENKQAFDDEYGELIDALPGKSLPDADRSAVWKRWKSKYNEIRDIQFNDLSDDDRKELLFEFVDSFHFYLNMMLALRIDGKQLYAMYMAKNAENIRRWSNGY